MLFEKTVFNTQGLALSGKSFFLTFKVLAYFPERQVPLLSSLVA